MGAAAADVARTSLGRFALSDLGTSVYPNADLTLDMLTKAMASSFTMPTLELVDGFSSSAAAAVKALNGGLANPRRCIR